MQQLKYGSLVALVVGLGWLGLGQPASAMVYFYYDAESEVVGEALTNPPFCQVECWGEGPVGTIESAGDVAQGNQYLMWETAQDATNLGTEVSTATFPVAAQLGSTYFLAYYMRFDRLGGQDIWQECITCQSARQ